MVAVKTVKLGGTASDITVGKVAVCRIESYLPSMPHSDHFAPFAVLAWFDDDDVRPARIYIVSVIGLTAIRMRRWRDPSHPLSDEDAFEAIKAGVDAMPHGVKMFLNSGKELKILHYSRMLMLP